MKRVLAGFTGMVLACVLLVATGCGPGNTVSGKVELADGTSVKEGLVSFEAGGIAYSGQITDGTYTVEGIPAGEYTVVVAGLGMTNLQAPADLKFTVKDGENTFDITNVKKSGTEYSGDTGPQQP